MSRVLSVRALTAQAGSDGWAIAANDRAIRNIRAVVPYLLEGDGIIAQLGSHDDLDRPRRQVYMVDSDSITSGSCGVVRDANGDSVDEIDAREISGATAVATWSRLPAGCEVVIWRGGKYRSAVKRRFDAACTAARTT